MNFLPIAAIASCVCSKHASGQGSVATFNNSSRTRPSDFLGMDEASRVSKKKEGAVKRIEQP